MRTVSLRREDFMKILKRKIMNIVSREDRSYVYHYTKKNVSEESISVNDFFSEFCFSSEVQLIIPP